MEKLNQNPEQSPRKEGWLKRVGRKALESFEFNGDMPYFIAPVPGAAIAMHYAERERARQEQLRLEAEERLLEPQDLEGLDDDEINIVRGEN